MSDENPYAPPDSDVSSAPEPYELAGRVTRLGGSIIDGLIVAAVLWTIMIASGFWEKVTNGQQTMAGHALFAGIGVGAFLLLNGYLLANYGQTIGKRILNMRIVSVSDGKILPFWRLIGLRYLPFWVVAQIPLVGQIFVSFVDPLFIFRQDRRCVHDLIAGTKVVKA